MGTLPGLLEAAGGFEVRRDAMVRELRRDRTGFVLTVGPTVAARRMRADAVVLAVPAAPASRLLAELAPRASALLSGIETASVVVVTLAFRASDLVGNDNLDGSLSGFLVPPSEGRRIKAGTFSFAKWEWVRDAGGGDVVHLRLSLGRHRQEAAVRASDEELVAWSRHDLGLATGLTAAPVASHVQRWGGGLPQYAVGHLDRIAAVRAEIASVPGLAVCGASYDGVGVPACIASAHRAVADLRAGG
ncbi:protoporphyrinogen/coproporphyrinogen oxidase [Nocardioides alcanivorans]|uniref:protoporphyrinogen/coproporphyrinogen oxidase n=1 Tax=Nocardioides alcanivorans TaxID=2897352 RepID=UPI001F35FB68|nr:FAD-dependent oxidoreductase [Nocardioides alcanivorans]